MGQLGWFFLFTYKKKRLQGRKLSVLKVQLKSFVLGAGGMMQKSRTLAAFPEVPSLI